MSFQGTKVRPVFCRDCPCSHKIKHLTVLDKNYNKRTVVYNPPKSLCMEGLWDRDGVMVLDEARGELRAFRWNQKYYKKGFGCPEYPRDHFTYKGHDYRPGFMRILEEDNKCYLYYDYNAEYQYDHSYHRTSCGGSVEPCHL